MVPALGKRKLVSLRPDDLLKRYARSRAAGMAPRSVRQMHAILHRALEQAVRWDYVRRNVADAVDAPAFPRFELTPPTPGEVARLIDAAAEHEDRLRALWCVAALSGCRQGELLGLRWQDVDLEAGVLHVRQTLIGLEGTLPRFGEPKTAHSRRTVTLSGEAVAALRDHRQRQLAERLALGPDYAEHDLVFAAPTGAPLRARSVTRAFNAALRRAGLREQTRFHDLRHAHATIMLQADVRPKSASARLGHSTIAFTMDLYTHALGALDQEAAERVQRAVRGPATAAKGTDAG